MPQKRKTNRRKLERVSVRGERRQPIDWDKHAWAMLQLARLQLDAKQAAKKPKDEAP